MNTSIIHKRVGTRPSGTSRQLDPRQQRFIELYLNTDSFTFGNCYRSAVEAGYSKQTAKNFLHLKPSWLSENLGSIKTLEPEDLLAKLTEIINNSQETTQNRLRAIDMMMRHSNMFAPQTQNNVQINIQSVLD